MSVAETLAVFVIHVLSQEKSRCVHSDIFLFGVDQWQHRLILNCELCRWWGFRGSKGSSISDHVTPSLAYSLLHNAEKYYLTEIQDTYFLQDICSLRNKNIEMTFIVKLIYWHWGCPENCHFPCRWPWHWPWHLKFDLHSNSVSVFLMPSIENFNYWHSNCYLILQF